MRLWLALIFSAYCLALNAFEASYHGDSFSCDLPCSDVYVTESDTLFEAYCFDDAIVYYLLVCPHGSDETPNFVTICEELKAAYESAGFVCLGESMAFERLSYDIELYHPKSYTETKIHLLSSVQNFYMLQTIHKLGLDDAHSEIVHSLSIKNG